MEWPGGTTMIVSIAVVLVIGVLIVWSVRRLEGASRRDEGAVRLQARIAEPISSEPRLREASVLPVVSVSRRGRITVELTGRVPSPAAHDLVLEITHREMARVRDTDSARRQVSVVDRVQIDARKSA
jgi:hypothetical protein